MSVREALLDENVKQAAVDYDAGLAYFVPNEGYTTEQAIAAIGKSGPYKARVKP